MTQAVKKFIGKSLSFMNKKKMFVAVAVAVVMVGLIAVIIMNVAGSAEDRVVEPSSKKLTIDDFNRAVRSPSAICLSPSFVEIMYRIKCEDCILAVTEGCDFPSDAKTLPNLGSSINLDWKLVEQLPVDVVMLTPSHRVEHARFAKLGKKVIVGDVASLDSIVNTMWSIGQHYNEEDFIEQWVMELDLTLTVLKKKAATRDARGDAAPRVLFVIGRNKDFSGKIFVAGQKIFYSDVIKKAGGVNVIQDNVETAALTFDELVALEPDIIIDVVAPVDLSKLAECEAEMKTAWETKLAEAGNPEQPIKVEVFAESWARRPGPRVIELISNVGKVVFE